MFLKADNTVILAAAGSRKTESIVEAALAVTSGRVLITTFTSENQRQIVNRIEQKVGALPPHISVCGWFSLLIQQCSKPYQRALTTEPLVISGLNFKGKRNRHTPKSSIHYFLDANGAMYRDGVSDFVVQLNKATRGAVVRRLERVYTHIFIDEVQDLVGYDLDVLDLLISSSIRLVMVGDSIPSRRTSDHGTKNTKESASQIGFKIARQSAQLNSATIAIDQTKPFAISRTPFTQIFSEPLRLMFR